jgi:hypothetical protein
MTRVAQTDFPLQLDRSWGLSTISHGQSKCSIALDDELLKGRP